MRGLALAILIAGPALGTCGMTTGAAAQLNDRDWPSAPLGDELAFLQVEVRSDYWGVEPPPPRTLIFYMANARMPSSHEEPLSRLVTVVWRSPGHGPVMAQSETCPAIRNALLELYEISPPPIIPSELAHDEDGDWPIPPRVLHGATYEISLKIAVANGNRAALTLVDQSGDYAQWAGRTERALASCFAPLS